MFCIQSAINIERGGTNFEIIAVDINGNKSIKSFRIERPKNITLKTRLYKKLKPKKLDKLNYSKAAIIIGIEDYKYTKFKADYANMDAMKFYDFAHYSLGVPTENIKELINEKGSFREILTTLRNWAVNYIEPNKTELYIFFAGHGLGSPDGKDIFLLPFDGDPDLLYETAIKRDFIFEQINSLYPKNVFVFLDTCYSGQTRSKETLISSRPIRIVVDKKTIPENFTVFSAAANDQTSGPLVEAEHGIFSYWLMKGMEGDADLNNDSKITSKEMNNFLIKNVSRISNGKQIPQLYGNLNTVLVE